MKKKVLIIGGGITGLTTALELAECDFDIYLVEREALIGGWASSYCCKAIDICLKCSVCLVDKKIKEVLSSPGIQILNNSVLISMEGEINNFRVKIEKKPGDIDMKKCISCDRCINICPADPKAIFMDGFPCSFRIDKQKCLNLKKNKCLLCREICPVNAITLNKEPEILEIPVDAIVVATGFEMIDVNQLGNLGYGKYQGVLTGFDLESIMKNEGKLTFPANNGKPPSIAFIQCVCSRNDTYNYCSQVCCKYAMRFALLLQHQNPSLFTTLFYIDVQYAGKGFAAIYNSYQDTIRYIYGVPVEIYENKEKKLEVRYENILKGKVEKENFDIVILSIGMIPRKDTWDLARIMGINLNETGFLGSTNFINSNETNVKGIFVAGACQGPKDIADSVSHGIAAAEKVIEVLI